MNFKWTDPDRIKKGDYLELTENDLKNKKIDFYWTKGPDKQSEVIKQKVKFSVEVEGIKYSAETKFKVKIISAKVPNTSGRKTEKVRQWFVDQKAGKVDYQLHYGFQKDFGVPGATGAPGITFLPDLGNKHYNYIQVIKRNLILQLKDASGTVVRKLKLTGGTTEWGLDTEFPYDQGGLHSDSPGLPIERFVKTEEVFGATVNEQFKTYVFYKPPLTGGRKWIYVPVTYFQWSWEADSKWKKGDFGGVPGGGGTEMQPVKPKIKDKTTPAKVGGEVKSKKVGKHFPEWDWNIDTHSTWEDKR